MAEQIDQPLCLETHSIPSGSISFGRFETESLSWERRSSFFHNKYLEEAEKYSKSGSVNQRKAYFEVYFRKKALLEQLSSQYLDGIESQMSEKEILDLMSYLEKPEVGENGHPVCDNESPSCQETNEVTRSRSDGKEILSAGVQVESKLTNAGPMQKDYHQHAESVEAYQSQVTCIRPLIEGGVEVDVEQKHFDGAENFVQPPVSARLSAVCHKGDVNNHSLRNSERKSLKMSETVGQIRRNISSEATTHAAGHHSTLEKKNVPTEKQSLQKLPKIISSLPDSLKLKDHGDLKENQRQQHMSKYVKENRKTRTSLQTSDLEKGQSRTRQSANSPQAILNSNEKSLKQSATTINGKSNRSGERRKEEPIKGGLGQLQKSHTLKPKSMQESFSSKTGTKQHKNVPKGSGGKKMLDTPGQIRRNISSEASTHAARQNSRVEKQNVTTEKLSLQKIPKNIASLPDSLKLKDHGNLKAKQRQLHISNNVKENRKTGTLLQTSDLEKGESRKYPSVNRPKGILNSNEKSLKQSTTAINGKSNTSGEKRKEEATRAELEQLQKSRTLKTKSLMQESFNSKAGTKRHQSVAQGSGGKKVVPVLAKSTKLQNMLSSPLGRSSDAATQNQPAKSVSRRLTSSTVQKHTPQTVKRGGTLPKNGESYVPQVDSLAESLQRNKELNSDGHDLYPSQILPVQSESTKSQCNSSSQVSRAAGETTQSQSVKSVERHLTSSTVRQHTSVKRGEAKRKTGASQDVSIRVESTNLHCKSSQIVGRAAGATTQSQPIKSLDRRSTSSIVTPQDVKRGGALKKNGVNHVPQADLHTYSQHGKKEHDTNGHDLHPSQAGSGNAESIKLQRKSSSPLRKAKGETIQTRSVKSFVGRSPSQTVQDHTRQAMKRGEELKKKGKGYVPQVDLPAHNLNGNKELETIVPDLHPSQAASVNAESIKLQQKSSSPVRKASGATIRDQSLKSIVRRSPSQTVQNHTQQAILKKKGKDYVPQVNLSAGSLNGNKELGKRRT